MMHVPVAVVPPVVASSTQLAAVAAAQSMEPVPLDPELAGWLLLSTGPLELPAEPELVPTELPIPLPVVVDDTGPLTDVLVLPDPEVVLKPELVEPVKLPGDEVLANDDPLAEVAEPEPPAELLPAEDEDVAPAVDDADDNDREMEDCAEAEDDTEPEDDEDDEDDVELSVPPEVQAGPAVPMTRVQAERATRERRTPGRFMEVIYPKLRIDACRR